MVFLFSVKKRTLTNSCCVKFTLRGYSLQADRFKRLSSLSHSSKVLIRLVNKKLKCIVSLERLPSVENSKTIQRTQPILLLIPYLRLHIDTSMNTQTITPAPTARKAIAIHPPYKSDLVVMWLMWVRSRSLIGGIVILWSIWMYKTGVFVLAELAPKPITLSIIDMISLLREFEIQERIYNIWWCLETRRKKRWSEVLEEFILLC